MKTLLLALLLVLPFKVVVAAKSIPNLTSISFDEVSLEIVKLIDPAEYDAGKMELLGTKFIILTRKANGLNKEQIAASISKAWPHWHENFAFNFSIVTFIDYGQFLGGGPLGPPATLGIYLGGQSVPQIAQALWSMFGWKAQPTAKDYILNNYSGFADPMQAYIDDMVTHELGHLLFGFGRTVAPDSLDRWFALGLGLLYDRMIWKKLYQRESPIFASTVRVWREEFSKIKDVDQRLVDPNTANDSRFGLIRDQTYCHGKAWMYLQALRQRIGLSRFDSIVHDYVYSRPLESTISYDDFLSHLSLSEITTTRQAEDDFTVR